MKILYTESYEESARVAAEILAKAAAEQPEVLLGLATGGTMEGVYARLAEAYRNGKADFSRARSVNLDEYVGCAEKYSYRYFMDTHLFHHINLPKENVTIADYRAEPESEIVRLRAFFEKNRVDLQLLGLGPNGHIGFNEPGNELAALTHIEELTESTRSANARFFDTPGEVPYRAITMGMGDILKAKRILLVVQGDSKRAPLKALLEGLTVTSQNPASYLLLHPDVTIVTERRLAQ